MNPIARLRDRALAKATARFDVFARSAMLAAERGDVDAFRMFAGHAREASQLRDQIRAGGLPVPFVGVLCAAVLLAVLVGGVLFFITH